jgi:hypothetical protein
MWEALSFALLGVVIVLLPFAVIAIYASRLSPRQRTAFLVLYGAAVLLLIVVVAGIANAFSNRLAADLTPPIGGVALGALATCFGLLPPAKSSKSTG